MAAFLALCYMAGMKAIGGQNLSYLQALSVFALISIANMILYTSVIMWNGSKIPRLTAAQTNGQKDLTKQNKPFGLSESQCEIPPQNFFYNDQKPASVAIAAHQKSNFEGGESDPEVIQSSVENKNEVPECTLNLSQEEKRRRKAF